MKKNYLIKYFLFTFLIIFGFETIVFAQDTLNCNDLGELKTDIQNIFNFAKILVPLLVIGFSSYDFVKAITGKDEKDLKKTFKRFLKRLALAVVFFFLPVLINVLLDLFWIDSTSCIV